MVGKGVDKNTRGKEPGAKQTKQCIPPGSAVSRLSVKCSDAVVTVDPGRVNVPVGPRCSVPGQWLQVSTHGWLEMKRW